MTRVSEDARENASELAERRGISWTLPPRVVRFDGSRSVDIDFLPVLLPAVDFCMVRIDLKKLGAEERLPCSCRSAILACFATREFVQLHPLVHLFLRFFFRNAVAVLDAAD